MAIDIENKINEVSIALNGDPVKTKLDIDQPKSPATRIGNMSYEQKYTTSSPTQTHLDSYAIAKRDIDAIKKRVEALYNINMKDLEEKLYKAGAGYTPNRGFKNKN